jgi:type IV pilus assembly protein PilQ
MRFEWRGRDLLRWLLLVPIATACALALPPNPALDVRASVTVGATRLELHGPGRLDASASHPRPDLYVLQLSGAGARASSSARLLGSGVVSSYRLTPEGSAAHPEVRLEVLLSQPASLAVDRPAPGSLVLLFSPTASTSAVSPHATPASAPALVSAAQGSREQQTSAQTASASLGLPIAAGPIPASRVAQSLAAVRALTGGSAAPEFRGQPISVNFKDIDLKDFFRLINEISGLNVVVDPNVRGTLTIVLDQVPWDQALAIVLRDNGLSSQLQGNVLRIATRDTLRREAVEKRDLAKAEAEAADVVTATRTLSYAKAADMRDTLKKFLSPRGEILADTRSNTLIIRDIPEVLPTLDRLIAKLDRKSPQVEIEARVVVATRAFAREIGTQFGFAVAGGTGNSRNVFGGAPGVGTSPVVRDLLPPPPLVSTGSGILIPGITGSAIPLNTNLGASGPTSGITFAHTEPNLALDLVLSAAETKGIGRLLSQPKLITQDNEKAIVKQGTKIPVQTVVNNTISVQFIDAVLQLEVTPQITADGTVFMNVHVENTAIDPAIPRILGIPALDTQSEDTKVLVSDGGTVVIGGIILSSQRTDISQVPLFGSIPIIGHLFKHTAVSTQSQELLFFLTPRVLPG